MHGAILSVHLIGLLGVDHGVGACQYPKYIVPYLFHTYWILLKIISPEVSFEVEKLC